MEDVGSGGATIADDPQTFEAIAGQISTGILLAKHGVHDLMTIGCKEVKGK